MPLNQIRISESNPIRFVPVGLPAYKSFDNDWFYNQIYEWQSAMNYAQKWVINDEIRLHFVSSFGPIQLDIIDCAGNTIITHGVNLLATDIYNPLFVFYESVFIPPVIDGWWYIKFTVGSDDTTEIFISEPQETRTTNKGLLRAQYWNSFNKEDLYFANGAKFVLNAEAIIWKLDPKSNRTVWENQPMDLTTIQGIPYREFQFVLGDSYGIPEYMADKFNRIFCMDNVLLDNVQYTQVSGSAWERKEVELYARYGYTTNIRQQKNIVSLIGENNNSPAETFLVTYNIKTNAFGLFNGNASDAVIQVTEIN